jgi:branched-chain amino acid transport system ATP-binding protein
MFEASRLHKRFGQHVVLEDVSLRFEAGRLSGIMGPNGAGKTTCFNLLDGQIEPDSGEILIGGRSIAGFRPRQVWRLGVGRTFQITATFGSMTVRENVQMALLSDAAKLFVPWGKAAAFRIEAAERLLSRVGVLEQAARPCAELAYGELKRVELALALANRPRLLLMDEPTAGMAPAERSALMKLAADLARRERIAVLFTEHDMEVVFGHADRVIVLHSGAIIASGAPAQVRADPRVQEVYLGHA